MPRPLQRHHTPDKRLHAQGIGMFHREAKAFLLRLFPQVTRFRALKEITALGNPGDLLGNNQGCRLLDPLDFLHRIATQMEWTFSFVLVEPARFRAVPALLN